MSPTHDERGARAILHDSGADTSKKESRLSPKARGAYDDQTGGESRRRLDFCRGIADQGMVLG